MNFDEFLCLFSLDFCLDFEAVLMLFRLLDCSSCRDFGDCLRIREVVVGCEEYVSYDWELPFYKRVVHS